MARTRETRDHRIQEVVRRHQSMRIETENVIENGEQSMRTQDEQTEREIQAREYLLTTTHYATERLNTEATIDFLESLRDAITIGSVAPGEHFTITRARDQETTA